MKKNSNVVGKRRFLFLLFLIFTTQISLNAYSQERKITFSLKNASLKEIISEIRKNSDYDFVYRDVNLESFARQDVAFKDATVGQILTDCLKGTNLGYEINGKTIIIRKKAVKEEGKSRVITGKVTDEQGNVLPGVTVMIKGTSLGAATNPDGEYRLEIPSGGAQVLVFSFVGMKSQEIILGSQSQINVKLKEDAEELEDVVVTGYFNKSKESFTGAVTSVKREELRKWTQTKLLHGHSHTHLLYFLFDCFCSPSESKTVSQIRAWRAWRYWLSLLRSVLRPGLKGDRNSECSCSKHAMHSSGKR